MLTGVDYSKVDANLKLAMRKALGDTIGVHWDYVTTPVVDVYEERKLLTSQNTGERLLMDPSGQLLRAVKTSLGSVSTSFLRAGGGYAQTQAQVTQISENRNANNANSGVLSHNVQVRRLSSGIFASFEVSTNSHSDGGTFQKTVDNRMKSSIEDGNLVDSITNHARAISTAYVSILSDVGIDSAGYSLVNISPTQSPTSMPTPFVSHLEEDPELIVRSNIIAIIMLASIGLLFIVMLVFVLHACGVPVPLLSAYLNAGKVAPAPTENDIKKDENREEGFSKRDENDDRSDGIKRVHLGQVAPEPQQASTSASVTATSAPTPDVKQDEIRSASMLDTPAYEAKESDALSNSENGPHKGEL